MPNHLNIDEWRKAISVILWSLSLVIGLSGCASLKPSPTLSSHSSSFNVSGSIAAKNQHQGWTATFYWMQHNPQDYQIFIYGPLGADTMEITQHAGEVTFREGKKIIHARQAEELLAKETGIRLPMNHLYHWIKGNPAPGPITAITRSDTHDIIKLQQAGYNLEYSNYRDHYPHKIRLVGHQLMVKIIIQKWHPMS